MESEVYIPFTSQTSGSYPSVQLLLVPQQRPGKSCRHEHKEQSLAVFRFHDKNKNNI